MIALTVITETATTLTVGWTPVAVAVGYEFLVDGKRVSNTWDPTVKQVKFGKPDAGEHTYSVVALAKQDQGDLLWPAVTPPVTRLKGIYPGAPVSPVWPTIQAQTGCNTGIVGADDTSALTALRTNGAKAWAKAGYWDDATGQFSMTDAQALALAQTVAKQWADVVVGWYVADEPSNSAANRATVQKRSNLLKSGYPVETLIAYYDAGSVGQWKGVVDAFALDIYPSRFNWNYALITQLAAAADAAGLKYYGVVGAFTAPNYPLPNAQELQAMVDTWAATKQSGVVFYAWGDAGGTPQLENCNGQNGTPNLLAVIKAA